MTADCTDFADLENSIRVLRAIRGHWRENESAKSAFAGASASVTVANMNSGTPIPAGVRIGHVQFFLSKLAALVACAAGALAPSPVFGAFGLVDQEKVFVVDSGAGLVFSVSKLNGNIVSIRYKGSPELQSTKGSHIASGFGACAVKGEVARADVVKISITTDPSNTAMKDLIHYLIVRKGQNNIYMATFAANEPAVGELRWITRLDERAFPNRPAPSNVREATKTIESKDVFGMPDGTTRSKYFGDTITHGKDRAMDMTYCGVSGSGVGVWMVYGNRESSAGGPFHRDIQNQGEEVYNYMNSGHNMTEPLRLNVLQGPYTLVFTDGQPPKLPVDTSWIDTAGLGLTGYLPASQRGIVSGVARGVPAGLQGVVGFSNATAQYWAVVAADGTFTSPLMKPGSYEAKLYQGELAVGEGKVSVTAGGKAAIDLTATQMPPAIFRIGEWDGTPAGFLNGEKLVANAPLRHANESVGANDIHRRRRSSGKVPCAATANGQHPHNDQVQPHEGTDLGPYFAHWHYLPKSWRPSVDQS